MSKQPRHGAFFVHFGQYLLMAYHARNRTAAANEETPGSIPSDALIAIVFSALGAEAFINELTEMAQRDADFFEGKLISDELRNHTDVLRDLAATLTEIEDARGQVELKYQMAGKVLSGRTFPRGMQPFQDFRDLMQLRNALVHLRHADTTDEAGRISPSLATVRRLQQKGLTYTRGREPNDIPGGMSWLEELKTTAVATWAYKAACNMVMAVSDMLPSHESGALGIQSLKELAAGMPTVQD
jgi:hypothetical protein